MRNRVLKAIGRNRASEAGQVLVLFAAGLVTFLAFVAFAVDVGQVVQTRTDLQKAADAAAFAGGQDLPEQAAALAAAEDYVDRNSSSTTVSAITFGTADGPSMTVEVERRVDYTFARVIGLDGTTVTASATVRVGTYSGGNGLVPWGLIASNDSESTLLQNDCFVQQHSNGNVEFKHNQQCTLMYGAGTNSGGDFGALGLDGTGADTYRQNIGNGSDKTFRVGDKVHAQTGNMNGPTRQGIEDRMASPPPSGCDGHSRDDVLQDNDDGSVSIRPGCEESPRIILIPVVDQINNPEQSTILGFAFMFVTGITGQGGHAQVQGEFVEFVTEIPGGEYYGTGYGAESTKLVD